MGWALALVLWAIGALNAYGEQEPDDWSDWVDWAFVIAWPVVYLARLALAVVG